jgi:hypothetical protein
MSLKRIVYALVLLLAPGVAFASTYEYYPQGAMTLGSSFNPLYPNRAYPSCLTFTADAGSIDHGAPSTQFSASEIKSRQELYHELHIDANLSASGFFGSGSASFSLDEKYQFEQDDDYFVLKAFSDYGRFSIKDARLNAEALDLVGDPVAFRNRCGTEYVQQERRSAQLVAVYSFQHLSDYQEKRITAALSGSIAGISLGGHYDERNKSSDEQVHFSVDVYAIGGGGIQLLSSISTTTDLTKLRSVLESYIAKLGPEQAAPMEFVTGSWESFGVDVPLEPMELRNAVLPELYFSYRENELNFHRLGDVIRNASRPNSKIAQPDLAAYQNDYLQISLVMKEILDTAQACLNDADQCVPQKAPLIYKVNWPQAVFKTIWADTDENGNPYAMQFSIGTKNLHYCASCNGDQNVHGTFALSIPNSQITSVDYSCPAYPCAWSRSRNGSNAVDVAIAGDRKSLTWYRVWDGDPADETYLVHYQVQRVVCTENCSFQYLMLDKTKLRTSWDWSSQERRALVSRSRQNSQAPVKVTLRGATKGSSDVGCTKAGQYCVNRENSSTCHVQETTEAPLGAYLAGPYASRDKGNEEMCKRYEPASTDPNKCGTVAPMNICDSKKPK